MAQLHFICDCDQIKTGKAQNQTANIFDEIYVIQYMYVYDLIHTEHIYLGNVW